MAKALFQKLNTYPSNILTEAEFEYLWKGSDDSRFSRIKRALRLGELIRLRRGLYCLTDLKHRKKLHPFELAQRIYAPSYISLESALSYHGLIPEAVYTVTSVATKRTNEFHTPLGVFSYTKLPTYNFYVEVDRINAEDGKFFIATPWKAITDYVYCYKKDWTTISPLVEDLRIDQDEMPSLSEKQLMDLENYYQSSRVSRFLFGVKKELWR